jgi:signal transduction histidine kinase
MLAETEEGESLSARQRDLVSVASASAARLRQVSEDIELLTHVAAGTVQLERADVPVTTLLREAREQAQWPNAPRPARTIDSRATRGLPLLRCDRRLTRRALAALIENALRFSSGDTPISVEAHKHGERIVLRIHDEGPGVAPENAERIFEPLIVGVGARPRSQAGVGMGLGLGLAVARACAEAHQGSLALEPSDTRGATFRLEMPFGPPPQGKPSA